MKILYVVPFVPWPGKVRSFNLIPRLARQHEIYLASVSCTAPTETQKEYLQHYCKKIVFVPHSRRRAILQCGAALPTRRPMRIAYCASNSASKAILELMQEANPDVIYVERWRALQFVPPDRSVPVVCDPTDSMTLYNRRLMSAGAWWERGLGWEEYRRFLRYEGTLARKAEVCVFCSRVDLKCVREQAPEVRYEVVPNGVDSEKFFFKAEHEEEPSTVVFTGNFKYRPNRYAVEFFLEEVFPRIRREVPEAKFVAVGNGAEKTLAGYRATRGYEVVGFVPELRPYLAKAAVAIAPLTLGSGVSNKLGEGFAVGTPVVATPMACGDLPVTDGEHLLIGKDASEFAEQVTRLLRDEQLRRELAVNARRLVEQQYDWKIVARQMEQVLESVAVGTSDEDDRALAATRSSSGSSASCFSRAHS